MQLGPTHRIASAATAQETADTPEERLRQARLLKFAIGASFSIGFTMGENGLLRPYLCKGPAVYNFAHDFNRRTGRDVERFMAHAPFDAELVAIMERFPSVVRGAFRLSATNYPHDDQGVAAILIARELREIATHNCTAAARAIPGSHRDRINRALRADLDFPERRPEPGMG